MEKKYNRNGHFGYMNESPEDFLKRTKRINDIDKLTHKKPHKSYNRHRKSNIYKFGNSNRKLNLETHLTYRKGIKSQYIILKKMIIKSLIISNFQTSIELSKSISINYKRNTISEACCQLVFEKIIKRRSRNNGKVGRPNTEFYIDIEKEEL